MSSPRFLVVEGNSADGRALLKAAGGRAPSEGYAELLLDLCPGAVADICYPADPGSNLPSKEGLESYDGVALTGSALHIYDGGPHIQPQVELARAVLGTCTPMFGSCWGLQVITTAAGGSVRRNPRGREIGFGRRIRLTSAGRGHPMYTGKDEVFNAVTIHLDEVETLAPGTSVLATNAMSDVQAAEIRVGDAIAWGVQYHPEYTLHDLAATFRRHGKRCLEEGFFPDEENLLAYANEIAMIADNPEIKWLTWRHALDRVILDKSIRTREIRNWIDHQVMPKRQARGRG